MPSASMAVAMVLAVYMPPHAPGPGQEFLTISLRCSSVMRSYWYSPYDCRRHAQCASKNRACMLFSGTDMARCLQHALHVGLTCTLLPCEREGGRHHWTTAAPLRVNKVICTE
jgi:hypothetical protein